MMSRPHYHEYALGARLRYHARALKARLRYHGNVTSSRLTPGQNNLAGAGNFHVACGRLQSAYMGPVHHSSLWHLRITQWALVI